MKLMPMSATMQRGLLTRIWCMGFADTLRNVGEVISPRFLFVYDIKRLKKYEIWDFAVFAEHN